jgi:hypothetical protein
MHFIDDSPPPMILTNFIIYSGTDEFYMENNAGLSIFHTGFSTIGSSSQLVRLTNIFHVPIITKNMIHIFQLTKDNDVIVEFLSDSYFVKD